MMTLFHYMNYQTSDSTDDNVSLYTLYSLGGTQGFFGRDVSLRKRKVTHTFNKFGPKIGPIFTGDQRFAPNLRFICQIYVKFANIWDIFSKIQYKFCKDFSKSWQIFDFW